jgi:hypothetical protein
VTRARFLTGAPALVTGVAEVPALAMSWDTDSGELLWETGVGDVPEDADIQVLREEMGIPIDEWPGAYRLGSDAHSRRVVAVAPDYGGVAAIEAADGRSVFSDRGTATAAALDADGAHVAVGSRGGRVAIVDLGSGRVAVDASTDLDRVEALSLLT